LPEENIFLKDTPYYYRGELHFIHWTTIEALLSILNYREIRLYNLYSPNDIKEFNFAAKVLELPAQEIEWSKRHYFTFSFCQKCELTNDHLWKKHGRDYKGVAIYFSIENDPAEWKKYMISKVYYDVPQKFKEYRNEVKKFEKYHGITTELDLGKFIGFHKENSFDKEMEIRLASYVPYKTPGEYLKFSKPDFRIKQNTITNYITLPLWVDNDCERIKMLEKSFIYDFKTNPKIKIQNIYFGENCGIPNSEFSKYRDTLFDSIRLNLGYEIDLKLNLFTQNSG
ncbi:MAG TPA: hypothetical protein VFI29_17275, partial [Hanamia sp.]|nr:hypothetical protein [Hanamia sp.]